MKKLTTMFQGVIATLLLATPAFASSGHGGTPDPAEQWEELWHELMIDITIIGIIFGVAAVYMLIKYKANNLDEVGDGPTLSTAQALGWALIPAFVFAADDFFLAAKGWVVWNTYRNVPENALEVKVNAGQWFWEFDYGNGVTSDTLNVPAGKPVVLRMSSEDVIHSFFMPKYRVKEDMMPGRVTYLWFLPHSGDKTIVTCTEYCGTGHSNMYADVVAMSSGEFDNWIASEK